MEVLIQQSVLFALSLLIGITGIPKVRRRHRAFLRSVLVRSTSVDNVKLLARSNFGLNSVSVPAPASIRGSAKIPSPAQVDDHCMEVRTLHMRSDLS